MRQSGISFPGSAEHRPPRRPLEFIFVGFLLAFASIAGPPARAACSEQGVFVYSSDPAGGGGVPYPVNGEEGQLNPTWVHHFRCGLRATEWTQLPRDRRCGFSVDSRERLDRNRRREISRLRDWRELWAGVGRVAHRSPKRADRYDRRHDHDNACCICGCIYRNAFQSRLVAVLRSHGDLLTIHPDERCRQLS